MSRSHTPPAVRRSRLAATAAVVSVAAALAVGAVPARAEATPTRPDDRHSTAIRQLDELLRRDVAAGAPGVVVRVDDGRQTVSLTRQAGWTRRDHQLTGDDQFRMGSNTKTMVAVVVLQLVAEHRLALTDPVSRYLPGLVPHGDAITLRMLLNHTSGLFDYIYDPAGLAREIGADPSPVSPATLLATAVQHPPLAAPGAGYAYSNTNYVALGMVLEAVTHQSVSRLLTQRIIAPLGLRDTYLATVGRSRDGDRLADAYEPDAAHLAPLLPPGVPAGTGFAGPARGEHVLVTSISPAWAWAAAAIVSTPADESRFLRALASGRLLPPAQLDQMRTTVVEDPADPTGNRYGLGLERYASPCGPVWGHTGGVAGYSTENYTDATGSRAVSIATTTLFGLHDPVTGAADQRVVDAAVCVMLGRPVPGPLA